MKVAIMQPYLFPYLGYYQLVHAVDVFVLYDDVSFIKQGFINRNSILVNGQARRFTLPVPGASSNTLIKHLRFSDRTTKLLKTFRQAYARAPHFDRVFPIVERVIGREDRSIVEVCRKGLSEVFEYLGLPLNVLLSSDIGYDRNGTAEEKVIQICKALGSDDYVNSIGGMELYSHASFKAKGCRLSFLEMQDVRYDQGQRSFVPNLSIIDALMWCDASKVEELMNAYVLHEAEDVNALEARRR